MNHHHHILACWIPIIVSTVRQLLKLGAAVRVPGAAVRVPGARTAHRGLGAVLA